MTYKFTVKTTHDASEIISDAMFELGGMGVCITDPSDFEEIDKNGAVWDYIDPSDKVGDVFVEGFFDTEQPDIVLSQLDEQLAFIKQNSPFDLGALEVSFEKVVSVDWLTEWKKNYKPIVMDKISIIPSWEAPIGDNPIFIEPGQAFGTGTHESTQMCLILLCNEDVTAKTTADVGCGSGIIGIAALKLGASSCYFCDLDEMALDNLSVNLSLNNVNENIKVEHASLLSKFEGKVDFIFANITADVLCMLASQVDEHLNQNGKLIVSGIIKERIDEVVECYLNNGFKVVNALEMKDWRALTLTRIKE